MDNPNIDNPNPKKEEYIIILDYLKFGYVNPERPNAHGKPIAQALGVDKFIRYSWQSLYRIWKKGQSK